MWNEIKFDGTNLEDRDLAQQWRDRRESSLDMEAKLVAQFRVEHQVRKGNRYIWWALSAAAAIALFAATPSLFRPPATIPQVAPMLNAGIKLQVPIRVEVPDVPIPPTNPKVTSKVQKLQPAVVDATLASSAKRESYTEFFPIATNFNRDQLDRGQVIRVQLPRSALFTIGMPVDVNRLDESIKADLVMGEDGVARAVRFVQ